MCIPSRVDNINSGYHIDYARFEAWSFMIILMTLGT